MKKLIYLFILPLLFNACSNHDTSGGNDKKEYNLKKMQGFYDEVMNAHNPAMVDSFCTADFIDHQAGPDAPKGADGLKKLFTEYFAAYPDLHIKSNFMMASGDTVIAHITMTGTSKGSFMGMPATNKSFSIDGVDIVTIKDGKAMEHWGYQEEMKMMMQLGLMPGPGAAMPDSTKK